MELKVTNSAKHISSTPEISNMTPEKKEKLAKASKDFEGIMTSMMLKSMTKTTSGLFGDEEGYGNDILSGMFETELSSFISKGKGLGIADMIYGKLTGEEIKDALDKAVKEKSKTEGNKSSSESPINVKTDKSVQAVSPSAQSLDRLGKYESYIDEASKSNGVSKNVIKSVILAESAAKEKAVSCTNAKGLMQLMDSTAQSMGVKNSWDPKQNIQGGTKYLSQMLKQYNGDLKLALAAYNAGPGNVAKYNGVPPFKETKNYISRVMGYLNHLNS
jgi:Rod binding domain-containing protein